MFKLGKKSMGNLVGVYPPLAVVVMEAIKNTKTDFAVFEGVRTIQRQRYLFKIGRSRTLRSYHLYGLAVDLVPYIDGKLTWESKKGFEDIEDAMNKAIEKYNFSYIHSPFKWDLAHWQCSGKKREYDFRSLKGRKVT